MQEKWPDSPEAGEARAAIERLTTEAASSALSQVRAACLAGKYAETIAGAQQVLDSKPAPEIAAYAAYLIAYSQHHLNHPKEAIPFYLRALANSKDATTILLAQRGVTQAYLDTQQYAEAHAAAQTLLHLPVTAKEGVAREQELAERYYMLAQAAALGKQYTEAGDAYTHLLKECPSSPLVPAALMGLGWVADTKKDSAAAMAAYQQMVDRFPNDASAPDACFRLGQLLNDAKDYQHAIDVLQKVPADYKLADQRSTSLPGPIVTSASRLRQMTPSLAWQSSFRKAGWPATLCTASGTTGWNRKMIPRRCAR